MEDYLYVEDTMLEELIVNFGLFEHDGLICC
jgi:hypothetical protein